MNSADGPLRIRLTWGLPVDSGRGSEAEPIEGYRLVHVNGSANGTDAVLFEGYCAGTACTAVAAFAAASRALQVFRVFARNRLGYGPLFAAAQNQAMLTPSAPLNVSAAVLAPRSITIRWALPADTGVGDASRALKAFVVERCFGLESMACTTACQCASGAYTCTEAVGEYCNHTGLPASSLSESFLASSSGPQRYYFRVRAENDAGYGAASATVKEQSVSVPGSPGGLAYANPAPLTVNVSWAPPADTGTGLACAPDCRPLTAIRVTCTTPAGQSCGDRTLPPNSTTLEVGPLSRLQLYTFSFYAVNDAGPSAPSVLSLVKSVDIPSAPTLFAAVPLPNSPLQILLTWGRPLDTGRGSTEEAIVAYRVELDATGSAFAPGDDMVVVCGSSAGVSISPYSSACAALNATVAIPAARFAPYYFRISASNVVGSGPFAAASAKSVELPSAPSGLSARVTAPRTIQLAWLLPTNRGVGPGLAHTLLHLIVQRSYADSTFGGCALGTAGNDDCAASTSGACCTSVVPGTATDFSSVVPSSGPSYYRYRVFAQSEAGIGPASASAGEQGVSLPSAPASIQVTTIGPARFRVQWADVADSGLGLGAARPLQFFRLEVCQAPIYDFSVLYIDLNFSQATLSYDTPTVFGGRNYSFRVAAYNDAGRGPASPVVVELAVSLPSTPRHFAAAVQQPLQINLAWVVPSETGTPPCFSWPPLRVTEP